ncbi:response regulator transcription factor [Enhygromyxa salina]|uniref:Transcriptional regulatory protein TcrA n=1 Tax=Enhygromyxa salina TaxID=215803 RepID=A0A2S9XPP0_9BACT|nr:response regulator transcription factor [Enhygromyxa salina]PRP94826.1 Transcriptional regulatory protein TcrA [Enhygromyxa salina]
MKVLVVEDDAKLARFIARVLIEEGYVADTCAQGLEAITRASSGVYDAMVLDWMLPDIDGVSVCRRLREQGCMIPILILTARGELNERVLGLRSGADDYLVKPFEIDEFLARLEAVLRRTIQQGRVRLGPLDVDRLERRVLVAGRPLHLTEREMTLLLYLVQRADQVVTRSELLSRVWGMNFDPESNLVAVHISRLRDKLGVHASLIETVRAKGYRLRGEAEP